MSRPRVTGRPHARAPVRHTVEEQLASISERLALVTALFEALAGAPHAASEGLPHDACRGLVEVCGTAKRHLDDVRHHLPVAVLNMELPV